MTIETTPVNRHGFIGRARRRRRRGDRHSDHSAPSVPGRRADPASIRRKPKASDYGPLSPVRDEATGLPLLLLSPRGSSTSPTGGLVTRWPTAHRRRAPTTAMAAFRRGRVVHLVRNHERGNGTPFADPDSAYDPTSRRWHDEPGLRSPRRRVAGVVPEPQRHDPQLLRRADAVGFVADV